MNTKVGIALLGAMIVANVGFASPLTDYSKDKVAIDVSFQTPKIADDNGANGSTGDLDGKSLASFGITCGLDGKLAVQFKQFSPKTKDISYTTLDEENNNEISSSYHEKLNVKEYNLLYQLNKSISVLAGVSQVKANIEGDLSDSTNNKSMAQLGFVASTPIGEQTTAYATTAMGNDLSTYNVGVSYAFAQNLELNLFYGYNKYKNLQWQSDASQSTITVKGIGYGLTYQF